MIYQCRTLRSYLPNVLASACVPGSDRSSGDTYMVSSHPSVSLHPSCVARCQDVWAKHKHAPRAQGAAASVPRSYLLKVCCSQFACAKAAGPLY
eukprot:356659-Chlamydomonas_euryale.AAC.7